MQTLSNQSFSLAIAYLVPGSMALWGVSLFCPSVQTWLGQSPSSVPSIGGFLYATLASLFLGLLLNATRRFSLDPLHHATGIPKVAWNYALLQQNLAAVEFLVAYQFRYYQFHGNTLLALAFSYGTALASGFPFSITVLLGFILLETILWIGSRQTLRTYYHRLGDVLGPVQ